MKSRCIAAVRSSSLSLVAALGVALLGLAACSADATIDSAEAVVPTTQADQAEQASEPTDAPAAEAPATEAPAAEAPATEAPAAEAPAGSGGSIDIVFDDGRTWSLETVDCYTEPDSAFGVFFMNGSNADGAELNVVESWPLDGDRSGGTAFIATFVDETGAFFTAEGGPISEASGSLSFESRIYEGLALEPTLNGTFSCTA